MKVSTYRVLTDAVERGVTIGWNRAHKHQDKPDRNTIEEYIAQEVLNSICEYFSFYDDFE